MCPLGKHLIYVMVIFFLSLEANVMFFYVPQDQCYISLSIDSWGATFYLKIQKWKHK